MPLRRRTIEIFSMRQAHGLMQIRTMMALAVWLMWPSAHASVLNFDAAEVSDEEAQARTNYERFLKLLTRQPKPGTALDRVFAFHLERGSLPEFVTSLQTTALADSGHDTNRNSNPGASWLLLGLIEQRRGDHPAAVAALSRAAENSPQDFQASWQLGRSLISLSRFEEATTPLERAITLSSEKTELLPVFQDLYRNYRRGAQPEKAREVLTRMEQLFADDLRIKEQIAMGLNDDGDLESALIRYTELATRHRDPLQATQFAFIAAQLKGRLGRNDDAVHDLESQLGNLNPESWLYREARRRIEDILRQSQAPIAMVTYYERWMQQHPDDVDGMSRLAKALTSNGREAEAQQWYAKALDRAPSSRTLRNAFIDQLIKDKKYAEAISQYEQLHFFQPGDSDVIEAWGQLYLLRTDLPVEDQRSKAAEVWRLLWKDRPDDPVKLTHVAGLMQRGGLQEDALSLYQRALELAPEDLQYREDLGALLWSLDRVEEANAVWNSLAEGPRRTTENLIRLAAIQEQRGQREKSLATMIEACSLTPQLTDRIQLARRLRESVAGRSADQTPLLDSPIAQALEQLALADAMAETDDERRLVLAERLACLKAGKLLEKAISDLTAKLEIDDAIRKNSDPPEHNGPATDEHVQRLLTLATYAAADQQFSIATRAVEKATTLQPEAAPVWSVAATLYEKSGRNADAIEALRRLPALDRRLLNESLKKIAELEKGLGHTQASLKAGRDLVDANPDTLEHLQFYASLCFELGQQEEGQQILRRMVRLSSADSSTLLKLAHELATHGNPAEAIEIYWRAMDAATDLETQMSIAASLAALHLKIHQFDRLVQRLEERGRELSQRHESILALATAFHAAGDLVSARLRLESIVDAGPAAEVVLAELARVCEEEGDLLSAADYLRRLEDSWPSPQTRVRLAHLLVKNGDVTDAEALWLKLEQSSVAPHELIRLTDQSLAMQDLESARRMCRRILLTDSKNWEALVRLAIIEWVDGGGEESVRLAREVVDLNLKADCLSAHENWHRSQPGYVSSAESLLPNPMAARWERIAPWLTVLWPSDTSSDRPLSKTLAGVSELTSRGVAKDFGEARLICRGVLWAFSKQHNQETQFFEKLNERISEGHESGSDLVMFLLLHEKEAKSLTGSLQSLDVACRMAQTKAIELQAMYLSAARAATEWQQRIQLPDDATLLTESQLNVLIESYEAVLAQHPEWTFPESPGALSVGSPDPTIIVKAAQASGSQRQVEELCQRLLSDGSSAQQVYAGLWMSVLAKRCTAMETLQQLERVLLLSQMQPEALRNAGPLPESTAIVSTLAMRAQEGNQPEVLSQILEWWLSHRPDSIGIGKSLPLTSQLSITSLIQTELNRFAEGLVDNENPFRSSKGRLESGMAAMNALRIDHLSTRQEIVLWQTLTAQSGPGDKPPASVLWATNRLQSADQQQQLTLQMALAAAAWTRGSLPDVTVHMEAISALKPDDVRVQLSLVELFTEQQRYKDALGLLDAATESESSLIKAREILALEFAGKAEDQQRALSAGQRLAGLQLKLSENQFVAKKLRELDLKDLAAEFDSRIERRPTTGAEVAGTRGNMPPIVLLETYLQQGNTAAAVEVAQGLIRRTQGGGTPWRNTQYGTPKQIRERAFQVLKQSGELDQMIARQKSQLEKSPHSLILMQKLMEYLMAADRHAEVAALRERIIAGMRGSSTESLRERAEQLRLVGQTSEACDTWLRIIELDPVMFWNHAKSVEALMKEADRLSDLTKAIIHSESVPPQKYGRTSDLFSLLSRLTEKPVLHSDAAMLLRFLAERHPEDIVDTISSIENKQIWQSPAMFELLTGLYAPQTTTQMMAGRYLWPETYESNSAQDGFRPIVSLQLLDNLLESPDRRTQLQLAVDESEKANPAWPGNASLRLILALHQQNAAAEIPPLVGALTENAETRLPDALAYELARLMAAHDGSVKSQAIPLLETSLQDPRTHGMERDSPALLLLTTLYVETQQPARGIQFLLAHVDASTGLKDSADDIKRTRFIGTRLAISAAMMRLEEPVAAWNLLHEITDADADFYVNAVRSLGYSYMDREWLRNHSRAILRNQIVREVDPRMVVNRLKQELTAPPESRYIDRRLLLTYERQELKAEPAGPGRLSCPLLSALSTASDASCSPHTMRQLSDALNESLNAPPTNLSSTLLGLTLMLRENHGQLEPSLVTTLQNYLNQPLSETPQTFGTEDKSRQIRRRWEGTLHSGIGLSCVAGMLAPDKSNVPLAEQMFERSLAAARQLAASSADNPDSKSAIWESAIWVLRAEFLSAAGDAPNAANARMMALKALHN